MSGLTRRGFKELSLRNVKSEQLITCDLPVAAAAAAAGLRLVVGVAVYGFSGVFRNTAGRCSAMFLAVHSQAAIVPRTLVS